ncbi:hypothetical protein ACP70R_049998 [Stipagrostis hirtigluma subsp. patula]
MSKRRRSTDEDRDECAAKRPALPGKQHLYLLVDDWERGYSVRKLDVDAFDSDAGTDLPPPERFTEPPVARLEALHEMSSNLVAHGTKILAMQPGEAKPVVPAFDTDALCLTMCPWPSCRADYVATLFVSAAGKLFLFMHALAEVLGDQPPYHSKTPWSWATVEARPPFYTSEVLCHALHPDGRTLFVSAGSRRRRSKYRSTSSSPLEGQGTFSFDAERHKWTRHGEWVLPFTGQAHFDADLEAWVGLCSEEGGAGRLCSCDVAPVAAELTGEPPWTLGKDKLFRKEPELHLGAKLLYMGDSKFCLVESLIHRDDEHMLRDPMAHVQPRRRVLSMTTFGLRYSRSGQLQTTRRRGRACKMYTRPYEFGGSWRDPSAFWL